MTPLETLQSKQTAAGDRYAKAVAELREAFIDLAAIDRAIGNRNVSDRHVATFTDMPSVPCFLSHPVFAPLPPSELRWDHEIAAVHETYVSSVTNA